jgi:hypothetical protein
MYRYDAYGPKYEGVIVDVFEINQPGTYEFIAPLRRGLNGFSILSLDRATIPVLPGGDTRPLLVLLNNIEIVPLEYESQLISVDESISGMVSAADDYLASWGMEIAQGQPFQWLGEGLAQGFRSYLWSESNLPVKIILNLAPGPSREDTVRKMMVTMNRRSYYFDEPNILSHSIVFDRPIQFEIELLLEKGLNEMEIAVLDQATINILPNGDTRPLLVQLQGIEILPLDD